MMNETMYYRYQKSDTVNFPMQSLKNKKKGTSYSELFLVPALACLVGLILITLLSLLQGGRFHIYQIWRVKRVR